MALEIKPYEDEEITIDIDDTTVKFIGNLEFADPISELKPYFDKINAEVISKKIKCITLDFTDLKYINSSGISVFVKWIIELKELSQDDKYSIIFICNPEYKWQDQSIKMLSSVAPELITVK